MSVTAAKPRLSWYRCPVAREDLAWLNRRSDLKGLAQTLGFLGVLTATGLASLYSGGHWRWPVTVLLLFVHGTCWQFLINGCHELVHDSVFRTRGLNAVFLRVLAFLDWHNHHLFWASHTEHHKYTLHPPDDLEVVLPVRLTLGGFLKSAVINPWGCWGTLKHVLGQARGRLRGDWEKALFPASDPAKHRRLIRWARVLLLGHATILGVSIYMHWWLLPVIVSLPCFYGGWLHFLCNNAQHVGLQDNVADFRLCCRTITLNPLVQFLYWHMNYHTEHHMFAAVPCYNLGKLHRLIRHDLPECPRGLVATWRQIIAILKKQKQDPAYQFAPMLPGPGQQHGTTPYGVPA